MENKEFTMHVIFERPYDAANVKKIAVVRDDERYQPQGTSGNLCDGSPTGWLEYLQQIERMKPVRTIVVYKRIGGDSVPVTITTLALFAD